MGLSLDVASVHEVDYDVLPVPWFMLLQIYVAFHADLLPWQSNSSRVTSGVRNSIL